MDSDFVITANGANKRRDPRVRRALRVRFKLTGGPASARNYDYIEAFSRNISAGGIFLEVDKKSKLKDDAAGNFVLFKSTLAMEISLPGHENPVSARGKPVWIEKKVPGKEQQYSRGVAVQFIEIARDDLALVQRFIDSVLAEDAVAPEG